jgi:hypothetical protein
MKLLILSFFILLSTITSAQHILSGYVFDETNGELLINATVFDNISSQGVLANNYGFFSLSLQKNDSVSLSISYVGYNTKNIKLLL